MTLREVRGLGVAALLICVACPRSECGPIRPCKTDDQCSPGQYCEPSLGSCVWLPDAGSCATPCNAWEECAAGQCQARYTALKIVSPMNPAFTNGPLVVTAELTLDPNRSRADPAALVLRTVTDGGAIDDQSMSSTDAGLFFALWNRSREATYDVLALWADAGLSSMPIIVTVDHTAPTFNVTVPSPPNRLQMYQDPALPSAWKRDEFVNVYVTADDSDIDPSSVKFVVTGIDGGQPIPFSVTPDAGCGHAYCGSAAIDLSAPALNSFNGSFPFALSGQDLAGNSSSWTSSTGLPVTRWKWLLSPPSGTSLVPGLAIGSLGTIYWATAKPATLWAVNPNGTVEWKWLSDAGDIGTGPVVGVSDAGTDRIYVGPNGSPGICSVFALDQRNLSASPICQAANATCSSMALVQAALINTGTPFETAFVTTSAQVVAVRPDAPMPFQCQTLTDSAAVVVSDGQNLYVSNNGAGIQEVGLDLSQGWKTVIGSVADVMLTDNAVIDLNGDSINNGFVLSLTLDAGNQNWTTADAGNPYQVVTAPDQSLTVLWAGAAVSLMDSRTGSIVRTSSLASTTAIWGAGQLLYLGGGNQDLIVADPLLNSLWETTEVAPVLSFGLDCNRDAYGVPRAAPGVLYFPQFSGMGGQGLAAVIVDSHGIATESPWPKAQRDPRNSGNTSAPMATFACP